MRIFMLLISGLFAGLVQAADYSAAKPGELLQVALSELHPTQVAIGHDQVDYKLGRYAVERNKLFDDYCEANGQGERLAVGKHSRVADPQSFTCEQAVGSRTDDMKTVVVGPEGQLFLTDGHHTFSTFWALPEAGPQLHVWVRVTDNFSDSPDADAFWTRMQAARKVRLKDATGQPVPVSVLPANLGLQAMQDDAYRSLVYFTREIAYDKPRQEGLLTAPEFLEFYWADWLRTQLPLTSLDLQTRKGYTQAVESAAKQMVALDPAHVVGDSGMTASQLGGFVNFNTSEWRKLTGNRGKLAYLMGYREAR